VMNERRLMGTLVRLRAAHYTPLRKNAAVHHSKNCALMSQIGQNLTPTPAHVCLLPPVADMAPRWLWAAMRH